MSGIGRFHGLGMVSLPFDPTEVVAAWTGMAYPRVPGARSRHTPERVAMPILTLSRALDMPGWLAQAQPTRVG